MQAEIYTFSSKEEGEKEAKQIELGNLETKLDLATGT